MKSKKLKQILATTVLTSTLLLTSTGISNAGFQSNQNTQYTKNATPTQWISYIRQMEQAGGAMGLSETQKSDLTSNGSNGIDVHMMRTTEYGAIAILSASGYGNPSNAQEITTSTGNETGIILNTSKFEWTAGGLSGSIFSGINSRYFDTYSASDTSKPETQYPGRVGDALGNAASTNPGCQGWHTASFSGWVGSGIPYFKRGGSGMFSFSNDYVSNSYYSRGVVVCGAGF